MQYKRIEKVPSDNSQKVIMKLTGHKTDAMFTRYTHLDEDGGVPQKLDDVLS
mgnify:CR=1 FL=1